MAAATSTWTQIGGQDFTGRKFARWTVIAFSETKKRLDHWLCKCDCGKEVVVNIYSLSKGRSTSCGCDKRRTTTHGMSKTPQYAAWKQRLGRCHLITNHKYKIYGGRGITMDPEWHVFEVFWRDMGPSWKPGLTLERIDNNGPYCKSNCKWATNKEQSSNRRSNVWILSNGVRRTVTQWCAVTGLNRATINNRRKRGLSPDDIVRPIHSNKQTP